MELYHVDVNSYENEDYGTEVLLAVDGRLEGYLVVADVMKPEASGAVEQLRTLGLVTAMLTGDERNSAGAIAKLAKIDEVHAELLPQDKLTHLQDIRRQHGAVLFVGDGINDAPVRVHDFLCGSDSAIDTNCQKCRQDCNAECSVCIGCKISRYDSRSGRICQYVDGCFCRHRGGNALCAEFYSDFVSKIRRYDEKSEEKITKILILVAFVPNG